MWCRLRVFIFIGDFLYLSQNAQQMVCLCGEFSSILSLQKKKPLTIFGLFSVGIRNHNSI